MSVEIWLLLIIVAWLIGFAMGFECGRDTVPAPSNTVPRNWHSPRDWEWQRGTYPQSEHVEPAAAWPRPPRSSSFPHSDQERARQR